MDIKMTQHQITDTDTWKEYTLKNDRGMEISVLNYGGIITEMFVPDVDGNLENVVIGFENYQDYLTKNKGFFGAIIGRVAGRIQGSSFELDGESFQLKPNEGENHLHGGENGFHQVIWNVLPFQTESAAGLEMTHHSPDGEGGYPGDLDVKVTYTLTNDNALAITYQATSSKKTPLTLTNHSYFNLSGGLQKDIQNHQITLDSSRFVELDDQLIPTGKILDVEGTPFDFRNGRKIKDGIQSDYQQNLNAGKGYDHYFIFDHEQPESVQVTEEKSRRLLKIKTDQPGMVMYSSTGLSDDLQLKERNSSLYLGLCLETQGSPASLHHEGFPSVILEANEPYHTQTTFTFDVIND